MLWYHLVIFLPYFYSFRKQTLKTILKNSKELSPATPRQQCALQMHSTNGSIVRSSHWCNVGNVGQGVGGVGGKPQETQLRGRTSGFFGNERRSRTPGALSAREALHRRAALPEDPRTQGPRRSGGLQVPPRKPAAGRRPRLRQADSPRSANAGSTDREDCAAPEGREGEQRGAGVAPRGPEGW